jgi:ABC-2 type transport system ATP-binding protein
VTNDRIVVEDLSIQYADVRAVRSATFSVAPGEVLGLLGGNGAGKSSTMRAVAGVNPIRSGRLVVAGWDMTDPGQADYAKASVGYCPDVGGLFRQITVRQHVDLALRLRGRKDLSPFAYSLVERFELDHVMDRVTGGFSHGMCRRLSVLLAAVAARDVLVLDEPFDGVDPIGVAATIGIVKDAAAAGVGVLISTHLLNLLVDACDRIAVMVDGTLVETQDAGAYQGTDGATRYREILRAA